MEHSVLRVIGKDGAELQISVLEALLESIRPAFSERADQIHISADVHEDWTQNFSMQFTKGGIVTKLIPHKDFHPFVSSSRIRILAGIPVTPVEGTQTGKLHMIFGNRLLDVNVRIILHRGRETVVLTPKWPQEIKCENPTS